ncbi:MAG: 4-hydroxythreonine-4-phosphate dehydrogenase PdxA [Candidatus Omnitrophota bacterium]
MKSNKALRRDKPAICITMGDPAGVGPEIIAKFLSDPKVEEAADFIVVGDAFVFKKAIALAGAGFEFDIINSAGTPDFKDCGILLLDLKNINPKKFEYAKATAECGKAAIDYIREAHSLIQKKAADAIVTAPINKYSAKMGGFKYQGHTEFLSFLSGAKTTAMMLTGGPLTVVLATTHIPISLVSSALTKKKLVSIISLIDAWMKDYFNVEFAKIGICALNPHAGEFGTMGTEEKDIIIPAVKHCAACGINVSGPYPADSLFYQAYNGDFDVILSMYHDQGLIPLKMVARDEAVNITLGLGFVRTSPAHGTAFDIAGKNMANPQSFACAVNFAISMVNNAQKIKRK